MDPMLQEVTLTGCTVQLVPLRREHTPALYRKAEPALFEHYLDWPDDGGPEAFARFFESWFRPASLPFAVQLVASGELVGMTSLCDIRPADLGAEIGSTWYARDAQGTTVNPKAKYLLLRHAFETLGLRRVQLKTSSENLRSQRAIEKLGAVREGILRSYQVRMNGHSRDTVMYSILDREWPTVKAKLEARLQG